jgi:hypothetical protein
MRFLTRPIVPKLEEPERPGPSDDRAANLLANLAGQGVKDGLGSHSMSPGQNMRTVVVEDEDLPVFPGKNGAGRHDQIERGLLRGEVAREDEWSHSPDDAPGRDRGQAIDIAQ